MVAPTDCAQVAHAAARLHPLPQQTLHCRQNDGQDSSRDCSPPERVKRSPRGPRVTCTASATLLIPSCIFLREALSKMMSLASARTTCSTYTTEAVKTAGGCHSGGGRQRPRGHARAALWRNYYGCDAANQVLDSVSSTERAPLSTSRELTRRWPRRPAWGARAPPAVKHCLEAVAACRRAGRTELVRHRSRPTRCMGPSPAGLADLPASRSVRSDPMCVLIWFNHHFIWASQVGMRMRLRCAWRNFRKLEADTQCMYSGSAHGGPAGAMAAGGGGWHHVLIKAFRGSVGLYMSLYTAKFCKAKELFQQNSSSVWFQSCRHHGQTDANAGLAGQSGVNPLVCGSGPPAAAPGGGGLVDVSQADRCAGRVNRARPQTPRQCGIAACMWFPQAAWSGPA